jgi:hypothetical protein
MQTWYVTLKGDDQWSGTKAEADSDAKAGDGPFATLARARDAVRAWRRSGGTGPAEVVIGGGNYPMTESFVLGPEDSGTPDAPMTWRAAEGAEVRLSGGLTLSVADFAPVTDPAVLTKLRPAVRTQVRQIDLAQRGVSIFGPFTTLGFNFPDVPSDPEVFVDDRPLRVSRWPKEGYLKIREVVEAGTVQDAAQLLQETPSGAEKGSIFTCDDPRISGWDIGCGVGAFGYWFFDWSPSRHPVASTADGRVRLGERTSYGVKPADGAQGGRFYFLNVLEELSEPGEYCLDRRTDILYLVPPAGATEVRILLSLLAQPLVVLQGANHVRLQGVILEGTRGDAFAIADGMDSALVDCEIRNCGGRAGSVSGVHNRIEGCHLHDLGQGGVYVNGGDRRTLSAACNRVEDCDIHDFSRLNPCYHPGVNLYGVGHRVRHNHIHHGPHFAIWAHGNDHLVEFNEIDRVCLDTSDTGAFYIGRNPSERGVMVRHNYFHHIGSGLHQGESAIYFDDGALGAAVGNVFYKAGTQGHARMGAIFIHMGKDVLIENNLFVDCELAIGTMPCGRKQWEDFLNGIPCDYVHTWLYKDTVVTEPPYRTAYPDLKDLKEYPDRNVIRRNVAYKCNEFLSINRCRRQPGFESFQPEMSANLLTDVDPGLMDIEQEDFRFKPDTEIYRRVPGFEPIPVERIGMKRGTAQ